MPLESKEVIRLRAALTIAEQGNQTLCAQLATAEAGIGERDTIILRLRSALACANDHMEILNQKLNIYKHAAQCKIRHTIE